MSTAVAVPAGASEEEVRPETCALGLHSADSRFTIRSIDTRFHSHSVTQNSHTRLPSCGFRVGRLFVFKFPVSLPDMPLHIGRLHALEALYVQSLQSLIHHSTSKQPVHTRNVIPTNTLLAGSRDVCEESGLERGRSTRCIVPIGRVCAVLGHSTTVGSTSKTHSRGLTRTR